MDSDRKSAVSSFYGGKTSFDALNTDFPRGNVDLLSGGRSHTAGYNRSSFLDAGRQEPLKGGRDEEAEAGLQDDGWDVYADFNNAGPKYSAAFGQSEAGLVSNGFSLCGDTYLFFATAIDKFRFQKQKATIQS
jgi:hypothetical protein